MYFFESTRLIYSTRPILGDSIFKLVVLIKIVCMSSLILGGFAEATEI